MGGHEFYVKNIKKICQKERGRAEQEWALTGHTQCNNSKCKNNKHSAPTALMSPTVDSKLESF